MKNFKSAGYALVAIVALLFWFQNCAMGSKFASSSTGASSYESAGSGTNFCATRPDDPACLSPSASVCKFDGQAVAEGASVTAYVASSMPSGQTCQSEVRVCSGGVLSGSFSFSSCGIQAQSACLFNGQAISSGAGVKAFLNSTVPAGSSCQQETRTCNNGVLTGTFAYGSCQVSAPQACLFNGQTVAHGASIKAFVSATVAAGGMCAPQTRTCLNGALSGTGDYASCTVAASAAQAAPQPCLFLGQTIANGQSVAAFAQSSVPAGQTCTPITRTCSNGTLSGSGTFGSCAVAQPVSCTVAGLMVASGSSITLYAQSHAAATALCTTETRYCSNGTLSGSAAFTSCGLDVAHFNELPQTDPNAIFRSVGDLVPAGMTYADSVPDTIDLAEIAKSFIQGLTSSLLRDQYFAPPGHIYYNGDANHPPTQQIDGGVPNWGKSIQALVMARKMSGYDLDDRDGTLGVQLKSTRNMLDANVNLYFLYRTPSEGAWIVEPNFNGITPMTVAFESMIELYKQNRSPALEILIRRMAAFHVDGGYLIQQNGVDMMYYGTSDKNAFDNSDSFVGVPGRYVEPFLTGKAMRGLASWFNVFGDERAYSRLAPLSNFIRNYGSSLFFQLPSNVPGGPGHFAGHEHGFLNAMMGILSEAEARRKVNPADPMVPALVDFVKGSYLFVRDFQGGKSSGVNNDGGGVSTLGNFGEICTTGDMIRLATKLTDMGADDYYDDVDRWLRNTIAENQIKPGAPINNYTHTENSMIDHIGSRAAGLFIEDAAHPFAIPTTNNFSDATFNNLSSVACGLGNPMMGIYDAWTHIVQIRGSFAQVNLLMNRASRYIDVKSEIPYRGVVHVITHPDLGPIANLGVRIPRWVNLSQVVVLRNSVNIAGQWSIQAGRYVIINNPTPNAEYTVQFPLDPYSLPILQVKSQSQMWQESNIAGPNYPYALTSYTGNFRGGTLINTAEARPTAGFLLYQDRSQFVGLSPTGVAAPFRIINRFIPAVE